MQFLIKELQQKEQEQRGTRQNRPFNPQAQDQNRNQFSSSRFPNHHQNNSGFNSQINQGQSGFNQQNSYQQNRSPRSGFANNNQTISDRAPNSISNQFQGNSNQRNEFPEQRQFPNQGNRFERQFPLPETNNPTQRQNNTFRGQNFNSREQQGGNPTGNPIGRQRNEDFNSRGGYHQRGRQNQFAGNNYESGNNNQSGGHFQNGGNYQNGPNYQNGGNFQERDRNSNQSFRPPQQNYQQREESNYAPKEYSNFQDMRGRERGGRGRGRGRGRDHTYGRDDSTNQRQYQDRNNKFNTANEPKNPRSPQNTQNRNQTQKQSSEEEFKFNKKAKKQQETPENSEENYESEEALESENSQSREEQNSRQGDYEEASGSVEKSMEGSDEEINSENEENEENSEEIYNEESNFEESPEIIKPKEKTRSPLNYGESEANRMCSRKEFEKRKTLFLESNSSKIKEGKDGYIVIDKNLHLDTSKSFSWFEINKRTFMPDIELALKKFQRSANRGDGADEDDESYVQRNKDGLVRTMEHIKKEIIDAEHKNAKELAFPIPPDQNSIEFILIYVFLWDRMREMIKDITALKDEESNDRQTVQICEEITRFFILSINEGRKKYSNELDFDDKMNKESLMKIMTPLLGIYSNSKLQLKKLIKRMEAKNEELTVDNVMKRMDEEGIYISPNEPEITSYAIMFSADSRTYIYENAFVGFELSDNNPLFESKEIQQVLAIKRILSLKNYCKFFDMLESDNVDYLLSCLMSLNVDSIRRDITLQCERSLKFLDSSNNYLKGVEEKEFMKMLRFHEKQTKEYKLFLKNTKGEIKNGFVTWNNDLPDEEKLYKPPCYPPLDKKLKRHLFTTETTEEKLPSNMRKGEIVSKSWHHSTYVEELVSCFLGQSYEKPKIERIPRKIDQKLEKKPEVEKQIIEEANTLSVVEVSKGKTVKEIDEFHKVVKRRKFLSDLSIKLADMFRPDEATVQIKKSCMTRIGNCIEIVMRNFKLDSINSIEQTAKNEIQKEIQLRKIAEYQSIRNSFFIEIKKSIGTSIGQTITPKGMSKLLKKGQGNRELLEQNSVNLLQVLEKNDIKKFHIKFFTDLSVEDPNFKTLEKIVSNIFHFLVGPVSFKHLHLGEDYLFEVKDKEISMSLHLLKGNNEDWQQFFGSDANIFLQTKPSPMKFEKALDRAINISNTIKDTAENPFKLAVVELIDVRKFEKFTHLNTKPDFSTVEFFGASALNIRPSFCTGFMAFLNQSAEKYRLRPEISTKSLEDLINEIASNAEFVENKIDEDSQTSFICFQEYINTCIQDLLTISKSYYETPEVFKNWCEMLLKVNKDETGLEIEENMKIQFVQLENLMNVLKFTSPFEKEKKIVLDKNDFVNHYYQLLKKFDYYHSLTTENISADVELLKIKQGVISGDILSFYQRILKTLAISFKSFLIILPNNYKFSVKLEKLNNKVRTGLEKIVKKAEEQDQKFSNFHLIPTSLRIENLFSTETKKLEETDENKYETSEKQRRNRNMCSFKYERENWLKEVKKQIKIE